MGFWDYAKWAIPGYPVYAAGKELLKGPQLSDEELARKKLLEEQAQASSDFANYGEGGFRSLGTEADNVRAMLQQHATGAQSFSRESLRQGLMQNQAAQRSFAAGAAPANSVMAARTAATNMARQGSGMAGQAALADIAERQAFSKALADATLQQRQQELQAALGGRQNANASLGAGNPFVPQPTAAQQLIGGAINAGATFATKK